MIGKIKEFNFKSLLILNTFALIATAYFFNNFIFIGVYTLFFFISLFTTKNGLKIIEEMYQKKKNTKNLGRNANKTKKTSKKKASRIRKNTKKLTKKKIKLNHKLNSSI